MFLGNPNCVFALLSDPGGPTASGLLRCDGEAVGGGRGGGQFRGERGPAQRLRNRARNRTRSD